MAMLVIRLRQDFAAFVHMDGHRSPAFVKLWTYANRCMVSGSPHLSWRRAQKPRNGTWPHRGAGLRLSAKHFDTYTKPS